MLANIFYSYPKSKSLENDAVFMNKIEISTVFVNAKLL